MADDATQAGTGAPSADPQPSQGNPPTTPTTPAPGEPGNAIENPAAKKYAEEAAAERRARKALEAKLAQYEEAQKQAELAKLGETERLQKQYQTLQEQHAALQSELQSTRLLREINRHGPSLNLVDPEAAQVLLERGGDLDYDADGKPTNVAKLLEKLLAEKPYLVASNVRQAPPPPSSGGATNPGRSAAPPAGQPRPDAKTIYQNRRGLSSRALFKN